MNSRSQFLISFGAVIPPCENGTFRFTNQSFIYDNDGYAEVYSARVEVCMNGMFVALCDSSITVAAAELACRIQSGSYRPPFYRKLIRWPNDDAEHSDIHVLLREKKFAAICAVISYVL